MVLETVLPNASQEQAFYALGLKELRWAFLRLQLDYSSKVI